MNKSIHIIPSLEHGGAETQLTNFALYEESLGQNPIIITLFDKKTHLLKRLVNKGVEVKSFSFSKGERIRSFIKLISFIRARRDSRIIYCWMYHAMFISIFVKLFSVRSNIYWLIRRTDIPSGFTGFICKLVAVFSRIVPDKIICNAKAAVSKHIAVGFYKDKIAVIPNSVDFNLYSNELEAKFSFPEWMSLNDETKVITFIGRYLPTKGHRYLLEAIKEIGFKNYIVLLVGRGATDAEELQDFLVEPVIQDKVIFLGERSDTPEILRASDFLVMPSLSEGFPNVVVEAMASSLPCIVTNVGDAALIVGNTGQVIEKANVQALCSAIDYFLSLPKSELITLGKSARVRVESEYSIEKIFSLYKELKS